MFKKDTYAVLGNPINHSRSPQIHKRFAELTKQDIDYKAICAPVDGFLQVVEAFRKNGGLGVNITMPFKQAACEVCDELSKISLLTGVVNTITFKNSTLALGDTTDGRGLIRDLKVNKNIHLQGARVLILGAGGAVRGILPALFAEDVASISIVNRSVSKAFKLAQDFARFGKIKTFIYTELSGQYDLLINATTASWRGEMLPIMSDILANNCCCYDLSYALEDNVFLAWARRHHVTEAYDGWGMLVEQAAESFLIWRGVRPDTSSLL